MDKDENKRLKDGIKPGFKDYIAIALAIFEIVMPLVLIGLVMLAIILFIGTKFWSK